MNRYRILATLSRGLACTQEAEEKATGRRVILKRVSRQDSLACRQFAREADLLLKLQGHHAPHLYECLETETEKILVEEFVDGLPAGRLGRRQRKEALRQLALLLKRIHSLGYLYLDIKPEHILWQNGQMRLIDFDGVLEDGSRTCLFATPARMAPELASVQPKTPAADAWAWGKLAVQWRCWLPLARRCLRPDPARRPDPAAGVERRSFSFYAMVIAVSVFAAGLCVPAAAGPPAEDRDLVREVLEDVSRPASQRIGVLSDCQTGISQELLDEICREVTDRQEALALAGYVLRMEARGVHLALPEEWNGRYGEEYDRLEEIRRNEHDRQTATAGRDP